MVIAGTLSLSAGMFRKTVCADPTELTTNSKVANKVFISNILLILLL
jgi:hypothetical protein